MTFRYLTKFRLLNEGEQDGGSGLDIAAAADSIGAALGFGPADDDVSGGTDLDDGESGADGKPVPPVTPAPTTAPVATPAATTAPVATPAATATPAGTGAPPPKFTPDTAPSTWTAAAQAQWAALPQPIREEIARRENNMVQGIEQYRTEANIGRIMHKAVEPALEMLNAAGLQPQKFVGNLVQAHMFLASDQVPAEQKQAYVTKMLAEYGITPGAANNDSEQFIDPEVKALRETVQRLESRLNGADQQQAQAVRTKLATEINTFAADPKNEHWEAVADDMAMLIRAGGLTLEQAYEKAVWANPVTRAKEIAKQEAAAVSKAQAAAAEAAEKAKGARGTRVRTVGHQGSGTAAAGSMDDTMKETLAALRKRE